MSERVTQKVAADRLGVTPRQVTNLLAEGLPAVVENGKRTYPFPECVQWYITYKIKASAPKTDTTRERRGDLELRRIEVELRSAELKLAESESRVVTVDYMEQQLNVCVDAIRGKLLSFAGKHAPLLVAIDTPAQARAVLEKAIEDLMVDLSAAGEDSALDEEPADEKELAEHVSAR